MTDIALLGMIALVALLAFVAGHAMAGRSSSVRLADSQVAELHRAIQPSIVLELRDDGLVAISGWAGGRRDSAYRPMPLNEALGELSALALELQQQPHLSSSDTHVR